MKSGLKLLLVTLPLVLIGVGFLVFTVANKKPPEQHPLSERTTAVRTIIVKRQPVEPRVTGFGLVRPARTYEAITQVGGIAEYVNPALQRGEILPEGAVLLRISPADFNLAIAQAQANISAGEAKLAELEVSGKNLEAALAIEQEALELVGKDLERIERLVATGAASPAASDATRNALLAQRQKLQNVQSSLALLPTQRIVQVEQIAVYQTNLATAELNLARTELTLPFAARVASVSVETGQFVRTGQTAAVLDGIEAAEVEAQVSVADLRTLLQSTRSGVGRLAIDPSAMAEVLQNLGLGANVRLHLGQAYLDWQANVDRISDTIDQKSGTIGVIVRIDSAYSNAEPGRRPPLTKGMFVEVTLSAPPVEGLVIPRSALHGDQVMLADDDNRLKLVSVSPEMLQGDIALIAEGLEPGQRVVVSSPSPVIEGMLLEITEDSALMDRIAAAGQTR